MLQLLLQLAEILGLRRARPGGTEISLERLLKQQTKLNYCCTYLLKKKMDHIISARQAISKSEKLQLARKIRTIQQRISSHADLVNKLDDTIQALLFARVSSDYASTMREATQIIDTTTLTEDVEQAQADMHDMVADLDEVASVLGTTDEDEDDEEALLLLLDEEVDEPSNPYIRASLLPVAASHEPGRGDDSLFCDPSAHSVGGDSVPSPRAYQLDEAQ